MDVRDELTGFVREALTRGVPRTEVEEALRQAGWSREQVNAALAAFAAVEFPIPVPRPRPQLSAKEAFLYLLLFTTLYFVAYHLGSLLFQFINRAFPDPAFPAVEQSIRRSIRFSVAALIAALPVFLYLSWTINRAIALDPNRRSSPVRRWLTYLTLFIAACILLGDFTGIVYSFLGGELTTRFLLKALTVGAIAGAAFRYYLTDLRRDERHGAT